MRIVLFFTALFTVLLTAIAYASDPNTVVTYHPGEANLRSAEGVTIHIAYQTTEVLVLSDSRTFSAENVFLTISSPGFSPNRSQVRAVLMNKCTFRTPGRAPFDQMNFVDLRSDERGVFRGAFSHPVRFKYERRNGDNYFCRQELSVVADGRWLVEPISGSHNFQFLFRF